MCTAVHKPYGFDPGFIEYIQDKMKHHFTPSQAYRALGISKAKFYKDIEKRAIIPMRSNTRKKRFFTGRDLFDYYLTQC